MTTETEHQTERREDRIQLGKLVEAVDGLKEDIKDLRESWKRDTDKRSACAVKTEYWTLNPAQIELERSFAQENNVEDRLNQLLSYFQEE